MEDKNCQLLFEYLRSILYDPKAKSLDLDELDEPFKKLGMGLQYLDHAVQEMKTCSAALSNGNLSEFHPSRDNFLCENLKNIHANLNHLTWQAKQVAKGDYSQTVSYLGEFSEAFNTMTKQLREREFFLKEEAKQEKRHASVVANYNKLLLKIIERSQEDILVTSAIRPEILYCSKNDVADAQNYDLYRIVLKEQNDHMLRDSEADLVRGWIWEMEDSDHHFYSVTSALMEWQGEQAYAHILLDITKEKQEQVKLELEASMDALTQIGNRHYFYRKAKKFLQEDAAFTLCYCDLDHLKYINDNFGHNEGDWYICHFVETVKKQIRERDVFARLGGDEFCLVLKNCPVKVAKEKMLRIREDFSATVEKPYEKSFSFGIVEIPIGHDSVDIEDVLHTADKAMYVQKRAHGNVRA